jgi:hypothetical protein
LASPQYNLGRRKVKLMIELRALGFIRVEQ